MDYLEYKAAFDEHQNDLRHFGVLGMKWGVRRYQNSDGTLTPAGKKHYGYGDLIKKDKDAMILTKGSTVQRVSDIDESHTKRKDGSTHTYVSFTDFDNFKYKASSIGLGGKNFTLESPLGYVSEYQLTEDIVVPSINKQLDVATEHVRNMTMKEVKKMLIDRKGYTKSNIYKDPEDFVHDMLHESTNKKEGIDTLKERAYAHYNKVLMADKKLRKEYFKRLQDEGYNAVADFNDQSKTLISTNGNKVKVEGFAEKPLIIFDKDKSMELKSVNKITPESMAKEAKKFEKYYGRKTFVDGAKGAIIGALAASPTAFISPALFLVAAGQTAFYGATFGAAGGKNADKKLYFYEKYQQYKGLMALREKDPIQYKQKMLSTINIANAKTE
jgi:hypothetical protein